MKPIVVSSVSVVLLQAYRPALAVTEGNARRNATNSFIMPLRIRLFASVWHSHNTAEVVFSVMI